MSELSVMCDLESEYASTAKSKFDLLKIISKKISNGEIENNFATIVEISN